MSGEFEKAITIQRAINNIDTRQYLLPAIQRKFTWKSSQIEVLFDSIMRGYPINTFMFWEVSSSEVKNNFRFYQFLERFVERFGEDNPDFNTKGHGAFHAIIDGQQRLTSLYLGLKGTYAYKMPRKWWPLTPDEDALPTRRLYLNISSRLNEAENEEMMSYEFSFLTKSESEDGSKEKHWFLVGEILEFPEVENDDDILDVVQEYLEKHGLDKNKDARKTLVRLYSVVRRESLIHYYNEKSQEIDRVLDIFIRTNHGGTPLSFSDLLISIAIASWQGDARSQIDDIVKKIRSSPDMGFHIDRDFILKSALMLIEANVRFKVENFKEDQVSEIQAVWDELSACLIETFRLIKSFGLNDASLRAKNAAIPVAYYLFHKDRGNGRKARYATINNLKDHYEDRQLIRQWLNMSLLKGVFGGQGDTLLSKLRDVIKSNLSENGFPLEQIIQAYAGSSKDLRFDDDFITRLLTTQKDDANCYSILSLLMPELDFGREYDKDHLHPESKFTSESLGHNDFLTGNPDEIAFYKDKRNWNSIVNLHLLDKNRNRSKLAKPLTDWINEPEQQGISRSTLLIPDDAPLEFEKFREFHAKRSIYLSDILKKLSGTH